MSWHGRHSPPCRGAQTDQNQARHHLARIVRASNWLLVHGHESAAADLQQAIKRVRLELERRAREDGR